MITIAGVNKSKNKREIDRFRNQLKKIFSDISTLDEEVLNEAVNSGLAYAKRLTPVGKHPNPVVFTVKSGSKAGKVVSFTTAYTITGGYLRKSWQKTPTVKVTGGIQTELTNNADYAGYWNYGHAIRTKKGGPVHGYVKGTFLLEKTEDYVNDRIVQLFKKRLAEAQNKHD